jgi:hypothetical protein
MKCWTWFLVGSAVLVAGCGSTHTASTPTTSAAPPGSTAAVTTTPTQPTDTATTAPPSTEPVPTTAPPPGRCATSQLAGSLGSAEGAAGTIYYQLQLRNISAAACVLQGYPGVSFVAGADGHQVGDPAARVAGSAPSRVLAPGESAGATLAIVDASNFGTPCDLTNVLGLRVYPPDQTTALFVPHADKACANAQDLTLRIEPLQ